MTHQDPVASPLCPPPRTVPWQTPLYLVLITTWVGWLLLLTMGWLFWNYCAFGADVKGVLFRAPLRGVTGKVTRVSQTGLRESAGAAVASNATHIPSRPIYAVRYTYPLPAGSTASGTSYLGGDETGLDSTEASGPAAQTEWTLQPGMTVPIEYVRSDPALSRVRGMRSNVYPPWVLLSLCIPLGAFFFMWPGLRSYRRICFLLASGVVDKAGKNLEDPAGHLLPFPIDGPAAGWLGIREGQLHAPSAGSMCLALLLPALALLANGLLIRSEWTQIIYTWHALIG